MLDLRTLDPARQSADRRVVLVAGLVVVATCTLASVAAGGGGWALAWGGAAALGGLPWFFAFGARWRLLDDALAGVPFVWRGDRMGVWATAPVTGALATLVLVAALGFPPALALIACICGACAHTALIVWCEARYERAIYLDLTVLELRFERITDNRPRPKGSDPSIEAEGETRVGVRPPDGDFEVQVRPGRKPR
jgi:hypothetical protein